MKKAESESNDWLRPEYERSDLGEIVRGKYAGRPRSFDGKSPDAQLRVRRASHRPPAAIRRRDSEKSSRRESLIEHVFLGDLMRTLWRHEVAEDLDVLRPETDCSGYDIVLEFGSIVRHIQLKTSALNAKTAAVTIQLALARRPSGCVIWVKFEPDTLKLGPFFFLGGAPGQPLPDLSGYKAAKHSRGDAEGKKHERPNVRVIPRTSFTPLESMEEVADTLFGLRLAAL
jgi:hypothetical protein